MTTLIASMIAAHRPTLRRSVRQCWPYIERLRAWVPTGAETPPSPEEFQDDYLESITSHHLDAMRAWNWSEIAAGSPPPPERGREAAARQAQAAYAPTFFEGLLGKAEAHRAELEAAALRARSEDEAAWRDLVEQWTWLQGLARGVLQGDAHCYEMAIAHLRPFEELEGIGESVDVRFPEPSVAEAFVTARHNAVPYFEYHVLASGRVSSKSMPRAKRAELVQAHICSAAIRVARELFSLLPAVTRALVNVGVVMVNPANGHTEAYTLLSVDFDRRRLVASNFDRIHPAAAVESFRHAMEFKKTTGLHPVTMLEPLEQLTSMEPE
jgi:hypothetical protein